METQEYKIEEVMDYLSGRLTDEEVSAFERRMNTDAGFEQFVREVLRAKATSYLAGRGAWKDRMRERFEDGTRFSPYLMAAAFAVLLLLGGLWWFQSQGSLSPAEQLAQNHSFVPAPELRGESQDSLINLAYIIYNEKNFEEALIRFDALLAREELEKRYDILYFKGMTLIELGRIEEAIEVLKQVKGGDYEEAAGKNVKNSLIN